MAGLYLVHQASLAENEKSVTCHAGKDTKSQRERRFLMRTLQDCQESRNGNIINMAIGFTAMKRVFAKRSGPKIEKMVYEFLKKLPGLRKREFDELHDKFCHDFDIALSKGSSGSGKASYGQAAKVLDVALKVCVSYCHIPDKRTADRVRPWLHAPIDTPILKRLVHEKHLGIKARTIKRIEREDYQKLQTAIREQIESCFEESVRPVDYDDFIWRKVNNKN